MGLDALKRNKRRPKKGQALILLAITIILILIIFWNLKKALTEISKGEQQPQKTGEQTRYIG